LIELDFNITIVGLGLIGGSFAMALKELNPKNLWGVDIDEDIIKTAEETGIIDKGYLKPQAPLENSDIVIICIYPNMTIKFIRDNMNCFKTGAIITDTAGIKDKLVREINSFLREDLDFIAGHPMAGREYKGLEFASKDMFADASYIITPTYRNNKENIDIVEDIVKKIGFRDVVKISPEEHDKIMALTSQLPHIIATALINGSNEYDINRFIAGSFKDATRVARINSQLWTELLIDNRKNILAQIENFEYSLREIKRAIISNERETLKSIFDKGSLRREGML